MRTIETKVYTFEELSDESKQKAIESMDDINVYSDWWDYVYGDAKEIGLNITSFDLDRNRHAKGSFTLAGNEVAANIFKNHGEMCETYKTAEVFMSDFEPIFSRYMDESGEDYESRYLESEMQELEECFLKSLLEDYSILLQNEYEYLISEDAIIETIVANGYEFTESGERF